MKKSLIIIVLILILVGCSNEKVEKFNKTFYDTFDTQITYLEYAKNEKEFKRNSSFVESEYKRLHKLYDNYKNYESISNVKTINDNAGKQPVKVEKDLLDLIILSKEAHEKTLGKVNVAMGSVLEIWHNYSQKNSGRDEFETELPKKEDIEEAGKYTDINDIEIDKQNSTVYIKNPKVKINLGATAKGYATELISKKLEEKGIKHASINAGGNVRTIGEPADGRKTWGIALQNPNLKASEYLDVLFLDGSWSVVTSGDYQRFFNHKGKRYHHIVDPKTFYPETSYRSTSVLAKDSGLADILSTAVYLSTKEEAEKIIKNYGIEAGIVWATDEEKTNTKFMDKYLKSKGAKSR